MPSHCLWAVTERFLEMETLEHSEISGKSILSRRKSGKGPITQIPCRQVQLNCRKETEGNMRHLERLVGAWSHQALGLGF